MERKTVIDSKVRGITMPSEGIIPMGGILPKSVMPNKPSQSPENNDQNPSPKPQKDKQG